MKDNQMSLCPCDCHKPFKEKDDSQTPVGSVELLRHVSEQESKGGLKSSPETEDVCICGKPYMKICWDGEIIQSIRADERAKIENKFSKVRDMLEKQAEKKGYQKALNDVMKDLQFLSVSVLEMIKPRIKSLKEKDDEKK